MGFWEWFRKKKETEKVKSEKVKAEELEIWLANKKNEIEKQEEKFFALIQERINQLIREVEEEIFALKNVKVEEIKAENKIKLIVRENLNNYTIHLEKLIEKLEEIKEEKEIIEKINLVFEDFKKKSTMSYEKATFLIGKEIANVKNSIRNFFRDLERILKANKELIDNSKVFSSIKMKVEKVNELKKSKAETEKAIKECDNAINNLKEKISLKEKGIEEIKSSKKFIEEEKKKQELEKKRKESDIEISKLRELVDFKTLAKFYHSFEKEMNMIKDYKENFKEQFSKTNGEELLNLFREAKMQDVEILNKMEKIRELKKELEETMIEPLGIINIGDEIKKINYDIELLNEKNLAEKKRCEKLEKSLSELNNLMKEELLKINVEVG